jgi:L-arabinokinase
VLSSFGGYGLGELPLGQVDCLGEYILVVAEATAPARPSEASDGTRDGVLVVLRESQIYDSGFRYEDLVRAADVVITKPGFGIIAECLANGTALVYTSRGQFREYPVLVAEMPKFLRCAFISQPDLFAGRWRAAVEAALGQPPPSCSPRTDGAEYVADLIQRELGG